jgi:hypothetical protein
MDTNELENFPSLFIFDQLRVVDQIISMAGSECNPNEAVLLILSESLRKASQGGRIEISRRLPDWIKKQNLILTYLPEIERKLICLDTLVAKLECDKEISNQETDLKQIAEFISGSSQSEYSLLIRKLPQGIQECDAVFYRLKFEDKIQILCDRLADTERANAESIIQQIVKSLSELSESECQQLLIRLPQWVIEQEEIIPFLLPDKKIEILARKLSSESAGEHESLIAQIAEALSKVSTAKHKYLLNKLPAWTKEKTEIFCLLSPDEKIEILSAKLTNNNINNDFAVRKIVEILSKLDIGEREPLLGTLPEKIKFCDSIFALFSFENKLALLLGQISIDGQRDFRVADFKEFLISEISRNLEIKDFDKKKLQQWLTSQHEQWLVELQRQEQERVAIQQFINLKDKYFATSYREKPPLSSLYPILIKIDSDEFLEEGQIEFLKRNRLFGTLAIYYQRRYESTHEPWELVKASGYWRDNSQPDKSIQITEDLLNQHNSLNGRIRAAIFTTRGGAFRDLHRLEDAEHSANSAIQVDPKNYYPYNLLGAIYFERGNAEQGEVYFLKALELGAPQRSQEDQMKGALKNAGQAERQAAAQYLLQRDPVKYKWAHYYLKYT